MSQPDWPIYEACAYTMMHLNHVINFFFYCLIGPKFRNEVKQLLPKCCCFKENTVQPLKASKSRNLITYPSTTFKRTPTTLSNSNKKFLVNVNVNNVDTAGSQRLPGDSEHEQRLKNVLLRKKVLSASSKDLGKREGTYITIGEPLMFASLQSKKVVSATAAASCIQLFDDTKNQQKAQI